MTHVHYHFIMTIKNVSEHCQNVPWGRGTKLSLVRTTGVEEYQQSSEFIVRHQQPPKESK